MPEEQGPAQGCKPCGCWSGPVGGGGLRWLLLRMVSTPAVWRPLGSRVGTQAASRQTSGRAAKEAALPPTCGGVGRRSVPVVLLLLLLAARWAPGRGAWGGPRLAPPACHALHVGCTQRQQPAPFCWQSHVQPAPGRDYYSQIGAVVGDAHDGQHAEQHRVAQLQGGRGPCGARRSELPSCCMAHAVPWGS